MDSNTSLEYNFQYEVQDVEELMGCIQEFSEGELLWYRGHEDHEYTLLPSLYRGKSVKFNDSRDYSSMHVAEQMRLQQYYAKDYPHIDNGSQNPMEWMGMAQHFGMNTRFLDWSTSAIHTTIFALEKYFKSRNYEGDKIPCLWVLKPQRVNRIVTESISPSLVYHYVRNYCDDSVSVQMKEKLRNEVRSGKFREIYLESGKGNDWEYMDYIYNISYFVRVLDMVKSNPRLAFQYQIINPLFLFWATIYIDGIAVQNEVLRQVPLAVIHPLNSDRIREQRGVFCLFPFPHADNNLGGSGDLNYLRMEYNPHLLGTLCKILLIRPKKICEELRMLGAHRSWLFNEPEYITKELEQGL